ncbi:hypothetical protein UFOVP1119_38 [uncultured Caudovirales phage]|uniref:Uncharacterized protein n=1 Tax=uncultured Caudovirales phage TaxID=2100421 RepID=A0A6J5R822_9CAUD|nr:hypothetical protein UFOVP1119_38 [uncultured Caudovirales phage]CAB4193069.1 hypothetical protein UFOVP1238_12 [uncultured Caudovirales phage]
MTFQSESKKSGDHFEDIVMSELETNGYQNIKKNVYIPEAGVEVDFLADGHYIEAKGGYEGDKKRPGAKRTDSVKKAIANGALIKATIPNANYKVYFSSRPIPGSSSDVMIRVALEHKIIDDVIYIEQEVELFDQLFGTIDWTIEKAGSDE